MSDELSTDTEAVQIIAPDVSFQKLYNGRIHILRLSSVDRDAIDAFVDFSIQNAQNSPPDQPRLVLNDFSGAAFTPYAHRRILDLAKAVDKRAYGRFAAIVPAGVTGDVIKLFLNHVPARSFRGVQFKVFDDDQKALAWLVEGLETKP